MNIQINKCHMRLRINIHIYVYIYMTPEKARPLEKAADQFK